MFAIILLVMGGLAATPTEAMGAGVDSADVGARGVDPALAAAEIAWDDLWVGRTRTETWTGASVRSRALVDFGNGRRALLAGDTVTAQRLLSRVPEVSPLYAPSRLLLGDLAMTQEKLRSAVVYFRDGVRTPVNNPYSGLGILRIAGVYGTIERYEDQEQYTNLVQATDSALPLAIAWTLPALALANDLVAHRRAIGWADYLEALPPEAGWFDPSVPVWSARARLSLCGYGDAREDLDRSAAQRVAIMDWLVAWRAFSPDRKWEIARDRAWPDARFGGWVEADFRLHPLIALARSLELRGDRPADLQVVKKELLGWMAIRLAEASTLVKLAESNALLVEADLAQGLAGPPRATVCYIRPPGLLGHFVPKRNRDPSLVQLRDRKSQRGPWHSVLRDAWYDGETQCTFPTEPVDCTLRR